jgi:hypothetical protein
MMNKKVIYFEKHQESIYVVENKNSIFLGNKNSICLGNNMSLSHQGYIQGCSKLQ